MYQQFEADRDKGNFDTLPELHAVLSGMKVCAPYATSRVHMLYLYCYDMLFELA